MAKYRFRFYGSAPADWAEGANAGHVFTVQFKRVPTEEEMRALGGAFAEAVRVGRFEPISQGWSRQFLQILGGERGRGSGGEHIGPVTRFLGKAHDIVPIEDAVYENAREGSDPWSEWSLTQGPPDPGPAPGTPRFAMYRRGVDEGLPPYEPVRAFEEGSGLARERQHRAELERAIAKTADKQVHLVRVHDVEAAPFEREPGQFGHYDYLGDEQSRMRALAVQTAAAPDVKASVRGSAELAGGTRLVVSSAEELMVFDVTVEPPRRVYQAKTPRWKVRAVKDGHALLARKTDGDTVYVFANDALTHVASTPAGLPFAFERDGRIIYGRNEFQGLGDFFFELVGLEEAVAAASVKKRKPARQTEPKAPAAAVEMRPVEQPSEGLLERLSFEPSALEARHKKAKVAEAPDGSHAVSPRSGSNNTGLTYVGATGKRIDLSDAVRPHLKETILGLSLPPSGQYVFVETHGRLLRVQPSSATIEVVAEVGDLSRRMHHAAAPADDLAVYVDGKEVHWVRRNDDGSWSEVGVGKASEGRWVLAASPTIAVVYAGDPLKRKPPKYPLRVWRLGPKKPQEVFKSERVAVRATQHEGRWYVRDKPGAVWHLGGLGD